MYPIASTAQVDRRIVVMRRLWRQLTRTLLDAVMPPACAACGEPAVTLCDPCRRNLALRPAGCLRCGEPTTPAGVCTASHAALTHVRQLMAPFRFVGTAGRLVRRFKLDGNAAAGQLLARAMADCCRHQGPDGRALLVAVPLHRARRRRRGFDQALWLARAVATRLGLRVASGVLVRCRATRPQGDALVLSRAENVRGAFVVRLPEAVAGRVVVLLDDVFTTGATARTCAKLLRQAGAREVVVLVACRS